MIYEDKLREAFAQVDAILAEALAKGEVTRGRFGCIIGGYFVGNDGSMVHHVNSQAVVRFLRGERVKELEDQIKHHRDELAKAMDELEHIQEIPN